MDNPFKEIQVDKQIYLLDATGLVINVRDAKELQVDKHIYLLDAGGLVIDVREAKELQVDGVIGNALHIPLREVKVNFVIMSSYISNNLILLK